MVDLELLLAAIAEVETQSGRNNCARYEPAYMPRGQAFTIQGRLVKGTGTAFNAIVSKRWEEWGLASAASWGPWQVLWHSAADRGYPGEPWALTSESVSKPWVKKHLLWLADRVTLDYAKLARAWNGGPGAKPPVADEYVIKIAHAIERLGG